MMKQEELFKKLGNILNDLNDQYAFLSQNPEQLSQLELELFLANANFLTDHIQIIKKLNLPINYIATENNLAAVENAEPIIEPELDTFIDEQQIEQITFPVLENNVEIQPVFEQDVATQNIEETEVFKLETAAPKSFEFIINANAFSADDKFDFEEKTTDELFDRPLSDEEASIIAQKKKLSEKVDILPDELEEDEIGPEPFLVHKEEPILQTEPVVVPKIDAFIAPIVAEQPKEKVANKVTTTEVEDYKPTINDLLAQQNNTGRTNINEIGGHQILDLKAAISLNDKLLYIKDLFNGYNLAYNEAIDLANKMPNFDTADNFFQKHYAEKNNWADKQATVDKFYLLLNKRFKD